MIGARHISQRRRTMLLAAVLLVPLTLLILLHPAARAPLTWSIGLFAVLLATALLSGRERFASLAYYTAAIASAVASVGIVMGTGGTTGSRFGFLLALPPIVLVVVPELPWASALAGGVAVVGGLAVIARDGRGVWFAAEWLTVAILVLALSGIAARGFRRLWYEQLEREARYARMLLQLADGERVRARAERVVLVSKLAARLAHELNNPLAAVKANVVCLAEGGAAAGDPATRELVADTRASVERIALVAAELRGLAAVVPGEITPCDVSAVLEGVVSRLEDPIRSRIRLRARPALDAVVDGALLAHCARHLVIGGASLDELAGRGGLCLDSTRCSGGIRIELVADACDAQQGSGARADHPVNAFHCGRAGLHLALAEELARALGGAVESARCSDGAPRLAVTLPAPSAPA